MTREELLPTKPERVIAALTVLVVAVNQGLGIIAKIVEGAGS